MITSFDSLYAGHVDMENVGYAGTPVNERWFSDDHLATVFDKMTAMALLMERSGYGTLWMAEHHFQREGYECLPNVLLASLHLSHLTKRLGLGCAFNIGPMWHPLRLAEDYATVDRLTGGRVIFGVGRGYHTREVETFGSPLLDQPSNRELFEEQVEIIFKAFNQKSFSHQGKHYQIPAHVPYRGYDLEEITLVPRPLKTPVECWQPIQGGTERALDFMAKYNIQGMIGGGVAEGGAMDRVIVAWQEAQARAGRETELGEGLSIGVHFHIADSQEKAVKEASKYFEENLKMFGPLRLVRGLSDEQMSDMADPARAPYADLPSIEASVNGGGYLCGPPSQILDSLKQLEERYPGMKRVNVSHPIGTPQAVILEHMQILAEEVMPAFEGVATSPVAAD